MWHNAPYERTGKLTFICVDTQLGASGEVGYGQTLLSSDEEHGHLWRRGASGDESFVLTGDGFLEDGVLSLTLKGAKGVGTIRALIETYFANGGLVIQFNILDPETLRDAQRHPEKYANLQVRVCGWNVRWNDIPKAEQDKFILRQECIAR